jgi:hypothetical protein
MMEKKLYVSDVLLNTFAAAHNWAIYLLIKRSIRSVFFLYNDLRRSEGICCVIMRQKLATLGQFVGYFLFLLFFAILPKRSCDFWMCNE